MLKEKIELGDGRRTLLNRCIAIGSEESFVNNIELLKKYNYDVSHYNHAYKKALKYLNEGESWEI
jgi:hypothetical protein